MLHVLFVCTGNLYRSPLAAAYFCMKLKHADLQQDYVVSSAGTWTASGLPAPHPLLRYSRSHGIDISGHKTREVDRDLLLAQNLIIVMELGQREALLVEFAGLDRRIFLLSEIIDKIAYDVPDPARNMWRFEQIADDLIAMIDRGFQKICDLANS